MLDVCWCEMPIKTSTRVGVGMDSYWLILAIYIFYNHPRPQSSPYDAAIDNIAVTLPDETLF